MTVAPALAGDVLGPHALSEIGACVQCGRPAHSVGRAGAVHTETGLFRCTFWPGEQCELWSEEVQEAAIQQAVEAVADNMRDEQESAVEKATNDGAREMYTDFVREIDIELDRLTLADSVRDDVTHALQRAQDRVRP